MKLVVEPKTQKGEIQLETIKWCQDQFNEVMKQYFNDKYRLIKGLHLEFRLRLDLDMSQSIKVEVAELAPETEERFNVAAEEAKKQLTFKVLEPTGAEIVEEEKRENGTN